MKCDICGKEKKTIFYLGNNICLDCDATKGLYGDWLSTYYFKKFLPIEICMGFSLFLLTITAILEYAMAKGIYLYLNWFTSVFQMGFFGLFVLIFKDDIKNYYQKKNELMIKIFAGPDKDLYNSLKDKYEGELDGNN